MVHAGRGESELIRRNWTRPKANNQLVHQSEKEALETIRRSEICSLGACPHKQFEEAIFLDIGNETRNNQ